jgi:hypothetical protein
VTRGLECAKCGTIFSAGAAGSSGELERTPRCSVCGGEFKQLVSGDRGKPWRNRDWWLWLSAFPGGEIVWVLIVLILAGIMVLK